MSKIKALVYTIATTFGIAMAYLGINIEAMLIYAGLMFVDFIFGVIEAWKHDKNQVTSKRAKEGFFGKFAALLLPLIVGLVVKGVAVSIGKPNVGEIFNEWAISGGLARMIVIEGYSILGHFYNIRTGEYLPEIHGVEFYIKKVASMFLAKLKE